MIQSFFPKLLAVFYFIFFSACLSFASQDEDVDSILKALISDVYPVSYKAEEVVIFFSESEAPKVHRYRTGVFKPDKIRRESYGIDGSVEDVIVHDSEMQIIYYPSEKIVVRSPREKTRDSQFSGAVLALIKANYDVHIEGEGKVSGRQVSIVSIMPKEKGTRPGFRVWLDKDYLLPLKTETYDLKGNTSYQNTYGKLAINPSFKQGYFVIMVPPGTVAYESASSASGDMKGYEMPAIIQQLPGGYVLKEAVKGEDGHFQAIYHDGLNSISVFSEDWNETEGLNAEKMFRRGGAIAETITLDGLDALFCRRGTEGIIRFVSEGHKYTVVGEASREGLIEIFLDIKRRDIKR